MVSVQTVILVHYIISCVQIQYSRLGVGSIGYNGYALKVNSGCFILIQTEY